MNKDQIAEWLDKYYISNYTINDDLVVDVDGDANVWCKHLTDLPFKFGKVAGYFDCSFLNLSSLKNCPYYVGDGFCCAANSRLRSLEYCPRYIGGNFNCTHNYYVSIKELFHIHIGGNIIVDKSIEETTEYKLLMKLKSL
jgi:hypothetical protein